MNGIIRVCVLWQTTHTTVGSIDRVSVFIVLFYNLFIQFEIRIWRGCKSKDYHRKASLKKTPLL